MDYWYRSTGGYAGAAPFYIALGQDFSGTAAARDSGSGPQWSGIGSFSGVFEGLGHTVSNVIIKNSNGNSNTASGIFGKTIDTTTIQNFAVVNSTVHGTYASDNTTANLEKLGAGTIVGQVAGTTILRNVFTSADTKVTLADNSATGYNEKYGGLVGFGNGNLSIIDSYNAAPIYSTSGSTYSYMKQVGGLIGYFAGSINTYGTSANRSLNIYNSYNVAEIRSGKLADTYDQMGAESAELSVP